jgi:energy-coupling factor transporter ATP-binding protein EcfA2
MTCIAGSATLVEPVELRGLVKAFAGPEGAVRAVDGLDLSVGAGEIVALLGPNGAGKSRTIDLLLGLTEPDAPLYFMVGLRRTRDDELGVGRRGADLGRANDRRRLSRLAGCSPAARRPPSPGPSPSDALAAQRDGCHAEVVTAGSTGALVRGSPSMYD